MTNISPGSCKIAKNMTDRKCEFWPRIPSTQTTVDTAVEPTYTTQVYCHNDIYYSKFAKDHFFVQ